MIKAAAFYFRVTQFLCKEWRPRAIEGLNMHLTITDVANREDC